MTEHSDSSLSNWEAITATGDVCPDCKKPWGKHQEIVFKGFTQYECPKNRFGWDWIDWTFIAVAILCVLTVLYLGVQIVRVTFF